MRRAAFKTLSCIASVSLLSKKNSLFVYSKSEFQGSPSAPPLVRDNYPNTAIDQIEIYSNLGTRKREDSIFYYLWPYFKSEWPLLMACVATGLISTGMTLYLPIITSSLAHHFISGNICITSATTVLTPLSGFLIFIVHKSVISFIHQWTLQRFIYRIECHLKEDLYQQWLFHCDVHYFERTSSSANLLQVMFNDTKELSSALKNVISTTLSHGLLLIGTFGQLLYLQPLITLTLTSVLGPSFFLYGHFLGKKLRFLHKQLKGLQGKAMIRASQVLSHMKFVMASQSEPYENKHFLKVQNESDLIQKNYALNQSAFVAIIELGILALTPCLLGLSFTSGNALSSGSSVALKSELTVKLLLLIQQTQTSLAKCSYLYSQLLKLSHTMYRLFPEFLSGPLAKESSSNGREIEFQWSGGIMFKDFGFSYPKATLKGELDHPIYKDFNLVIRPAEIVAICGASGIGKSTLPQFLEKFYLDYQGSIYLQNSQDEGKYYELSKKKDSSEDGWLRSQIAYLPQESIFFDDSIVNSILYGSLLNETSTNSAHDTIDGSLNVADASCTRVIEAATMAEAHHFIINDLEEGYATRTGFQGSRLSGGQRQRLALTRAFLKEPKLIILDEATSALDPITHTKIQNALRKYLKERSVTCIIIAHHVESLKLADRVILLGKRETTDSVTEILEMGSHEDLMRRRGKYYTLFTSNNQLE